MDYYAAEDDNNTNTEFNNINNGFALDQTRNILYPLIAALGIIANVFVILVIVVTERFRKNRTVANTFVMNLAIADILFLIMLPFHMPMWHQEGYPYPDAMCTIHEATTHISYHSSILFLTGMSADRYMAIVHSLRSLQYRTQRNARIACAVLWIASIITSIPILIYAQVEKYADSNGTISSGRCMLIFPGHENSTVSTEELLKILDVSGSGLYDDLGNSSDNLYDGDTFGNFDYDPEAVYNDFDPNICHSQGHGNEDSLLFRAWQWFTFTVFFLLPIIVVVFCYCKIWRATAIRKVRSQQAEGNIEQQSLQPQQNPPKQSWKQIQYKITIMVAVLVSAFILSWLPFQIWILLTLPPGIKLSDTHSCEVITLTVELLAWTNSLMNPILYSITSENFRKRATTTLFFLRYGYRRTMRMSVTRSSRTGFGRTEKTDMILQSVPPGTSPKNDRRSETQISPPPTPIDSNSPVARF